MTSRKSLPGEIVSVLGSYVKGQIMIWLITTVLYLIGFAAVRAPWWFLIGVLLPLVDWVPHLGPVLGLGIALGIAALGGADFNHILMVAGVWLVVQSISGYVLQPRILGHRLGMSPLTVFFVTIIGGVLFPPFGFLFAVPVAAVIAIVWKRFSGNGGITASNPTMRR